MYGSGPNIGGGGLVTALGSGVAGVGSLAYTGFSSFAVALFAVCLVACGTVLLRVLAVRKQPVNREGNAGL
ncbi:hypothetical protein FHU41_002759 [Psychromicrobium silvestre]|uniref:Uncharacterized protein n=1 Tax=Psychromicrobium silvestre TaxID=1645614 RepID=A0A7Y9LVS2_9MICC|nr:hypothetical protein [Psychromicrobium silvestre]